MDDPHEHTFMATFGRLTAISIAIAKLIELSENPELTRAAIRGQIEGVLSLFEVSIEPHHLTAAEGMREQMEELLTMD